jgi:hypothetical protein
LFWEDPDRLPSREPYLQADAPRVERWRDRLAADGSGLRVGLSWAGSPTHGYDVLRSIDLGRFQPILDVPGVRFYSLQAGASAGRIAELDLEGKITGNLVNEADFENTAALVANLDLVITVDTAICHLAGGLGRPTWTLLHYSPDWRWLLGSEQTNWYPQMTLFRQAQPGIEAWSEVIERVRSRLESVRATA